MTILSKRLLVLFVLVAAATASRAGPVNINTADAETIARELEGIGLARAQAIVSYREQHGHFATVEAVRNVKGVGPKILELNRNNIHLETPEK